MARFDGEKFDPAQRGKGRNWMRWKNTRPRLATTTPIDNASGPSGRASIGDASEPASHCCDPP